MGKIYLIRHGQTDSNKSKTFQGRTDTLLNESGLAQAQKLGEYFKNIHLDAIYSSSLRRAQMTAQPLAGSHKLELKTRDELQEVAFGDWEGLDYEAINAKWPGQIDIFFEKPGDVVPPNAEGFAAAKERAMQALREIIAAEGGEKDIAIVSHGGIIRLLICGLLDIPLNNLWRLNVHNASVSVFTNWENSFFCDAINDYHYLKEL